MTHKEIFPAIEDRALLDGAISAVNEWKMLLSLEKNFIFIHIPKTAGDLDHACAQTMEPKRTQWRRILSHLPVRETPERAALR